MNRELKQGRRRGEISESVTERRENMNRIKEGLGIERDDILVTRETMEQLEGAGTDEGAEEVREAIEQAENVTTELFDQDGESLEEEHEDSRDNEAELKESSDSVQRDSERIGDARGRIDTSENLRELERALDHASTDKEFLELHIERLEEAIRQSEADYQALSAQVHA